MKNKFKSMSFWTSLSGAIVVLLNVIGSCFGFNVNGDIVNQIVMAIAGILVVLGVVTMPQASKDESESGGDGDDNNEQLPENIQKDDDKNNEDNK